MGMSMNFKNAKISTKILMIVAGFGMALGVVAAIGWLSLENMAKSANRIELAAEQIELTARLDHDAIDLNRNEYRLAANPAEFEEIRNAIKHDEADFETLLEELRSIASDSMQPALEDIEHAYAAYVADIEKSLTLAETTEAELSQDQLNLLEAVAHSVPLMEELEHLITDFAEQAQQNALQTAHAAERTAHISEFLIIAVGILSVITGVTTAIFISQRFISSPLQRVVQGLAKVSSGDLTHEIDNDDRKDEIGELNQALDRFIVSAREKIELMQKQEAEDRLKLERAEKVRNLTERFQLDISEAITSLAGAAEEMEATAVSMSATAEETNAQTHSVSSVTVQTTSNVQTVAAATEEMLAAISSVSEQMGRGAGVAAEARNRTQTTIEKLSVLSNSADAIGDILKLITDVTAQTKLLALNATIEAVRAGEAGKGFNVVAHEVKALAEQTENATASVTRQIKEIQDATAEIVASVNDISAAVEDVNDVTTIVAASTEQQVASTAEISKNVSEVSTGTSHVSDSLVMLEEAAQTTASASVQVTSTARELSHQSLNIKNRIDGYLASVEAA